MDRALMPVGEDDDGRDLVTKTNGGRAAVAHARRVAEITGSNS